MKQRIPPTPPVAAGAPAAILGIGMLTPVGLTADRTAKSIRAQIARIQDSPFLNDRYEPLAMGWIEDDLIPPIGEDLLLSGALHPLVSRLLRLGGEPLAAAANLLSQVEACPLFLAMPAPLPGQESALPPDFLALFSQQSGVPFNVKGSQTLCQGRAGCFQAVQKGVEALFRPDGPEAVLVGGLDSYFDPDLIKHYGQVEHRILAEGIPDGFIPGEGAAFLLLSTPARCQRQGWTPMAVIQGVGLGIEAGHLYSDQPYRGDGLAAAFGALFGSTQSAPVQTVFAGFNGENLWAKEWGTSTTSPKYLY